MDLGPSCSRASLQRGAPYAAPGRPTRLLCAPCRANQYDHSARVKGSIKRVYKYVSDFKHLPDWYPGVSSVQRVRGKGVELKNVYTVETNILRMQHTSYYEIVDVDPGRKVVYVGDSKMHSAEHQLYFMQDPTDGSFTNIRYIKKFKFKSAAGALQPLLAGAIGKFPEQGLSNLVKLLSSPSTPLHSVELDPWEVEEENRAARSKNWPSWQSVWDGLGLGAMPSGTGGSTLLKAAPAFVDTYGFYAVMGLDPKRRNAYTADDIKAAYRRAAMDLHPDKLVGADSREQQVATAKFQQLQRAYSVLKDPQHKQMYDKGQLLQQELVM